MSEYSSFDYYIAELGSLEPFTAKEEKEHFFRYVKFRDKKTRSKKLLKDGEDAYEEIIKRNLRLVVKIAKKYLNLGIPMQDLVAEGNLGLITAVERFDPNKDVKFSTYASFWIKQYMRRTLSNDSRVVRLPSGLIDQRNKILAYIEEYEKVNNRKPEIKQISKKLRLSKDRVLLILQTNQTTRSLDFKISEDSDDTFGDLLKDSNQKVPFESTRFNDEVFILSKAIDSLPNREKLIIQYRYGLNNNDQMTLERIGDTFNLTRERIRQLERMAMWRLENYMKQQNIINL